LVPFPRSVPRHHPVSELYGQFTWPHGLVFALTCAVNCGTLYRQVYLFPNQLNLPQVDSNQAVETSRMINGNRMHLSSISSLIAKSLNTEIWDVFYLRHLKTDLNKRFCFVIMGYYDVIMRYCDYTQLNDLISVVLASYIAVFAVFVSKIIV
jgi:hypothetical protein